MNGTKRHIAVDTAGLLLTVLITAASVRDYERLPAHHEAYVYWVMIMIMTRRLARQPTAVKSQAA